jgi:hypothetical protein
MYSPPLHVSLAALRLLEPVVAVQWVFHYIFWIEVFLQNQ